MGSSTRKIVVSGLIVSFVLFGLFVSGVQAQETVVLRFADTPYAPDVMKKMEEFFKIFAERYPNIKVEVERYDFNNFQEKLTIQAAGADLPDVFYLQDPWVRRWVQEGQLMDLTPFIKRDAELVKPDDFYSIALKLVSWKGGIYGIPEDVSPLGIHLYNVGLFDEAGLSYPSEDWTLEGEFLEACKKLTKDTNGNGEIDQFGYFSESIEGLVVSPEFEAVYLMPFGGRFLNDDETECLLTKPESIKALQWWVDLMYKYHVFPTPAEAAAYKPGLSMLGSDKVGMSFGYPWADAMLMKYPECKWDVMYAPKGPAGRFSSVNGSCFAIAKSTEHPEEAWIFLRHL